LTQTVPEPTFYATPGEWRAWLAEHDAGAREHWVGFHRSSRWSRVNVARVAELEAGGRMHPAGLAAFAARTEVATHAYEQRAAAALDPERERRLRANAAAAAFFDARPPGYRRTATHWVMSAQREATRDRRLAQLIEDSAAGRRIAPLARAS
jgi:uncharacterized protein YdeI (YjbR/CyaY-like superfamily)